MSADLNYIFGCQCHVKNGIAVHDKNTVLFLAGEMCVLHNMEHNEQKFLPFPEMKMPTAMAHGPKNIIAVANKLPTARVIIYDTESLSRKALPSPETNITDYQWLCFSSDWEFLLGQGGPPSFTLVMWAWEKRIISSVFMPMSIKPDAEIIQVAFHPRQKKHVVAIGKEYLKLYKYKREEGFKSCFFSYLELGTDFLCIEWLPNGWLAIGTGNGKILFFDDLELVDEIVVSNEYHDVRLHSKKAKGDAAGTQSNAITGIVSTSRSLFCVYGDVTVIEYSPSGDFKNYKFSKTIEFPGTEINMDDSEHFFKITCIKLSPPDDLIVFTSTGQLLSYSLIGNEHNKGHKCYFKVLTQQVHRSKIVGMDLAINQPFIVTSSERTIVLWHYIKKIRVVRKTFGAKILCVGLHPLGLYVVAGFEDHTALYKIFYDRFVKLVEIQTTDCNKAVFAHGGHLLAIANGFNIELYDFVTGLKRAELIGHCEVIKEIIWNNCDSMLISCDNKGVICIWNVIKKQKIGEVSLESGINGIALSDGGKSIYAATHDGYLFEITEGLVLRKVRTSPAIASLYSFDAGHLVYTGMENGNLRLFNTSSSNLCVEGSDKFAHMGKITKMTMTTSRDYLMTTGEDGMLAIWKLSHKVPLPKLSLKFLNCILIEQHSLEEHSNIVEKLEKTLCEFQIDATLALEEKDAFHKKELLMSQNNLEKKILDLKSAIKHLSEGNRSMLKDNMERHLQIQEQELTACDELEQATQQKILLEFSRFDNLWAQSKSQEEIAMSRMHHLRQKHEAKLNDLVNDFEEKVLAKELAILQGRNNMQEMQMEHTEMCKQLVSKSDAEIEDVKSNFARDAQLQKEDVQGLEEANQLAQKKSQLLRKEIEERKKQLALRAGITSGLENRILELEKCISDTQGEIEAKGATIDNLGEEISQILEHQQNMKKHESVLNTALQNKTKSEDSSDNFSVEENKIIKELEAELNTLHAEDIKLKLEMELLDNKNKSIMKELRKETLKGRGFDSSLEGYRNDLSACATVLNNAQKLKSYVRKILESHSGLQKHKGDGLLSKDTSDFPREHLEKTLHLLRKQMFRERKMHHQQCAKMNKEKDENQRSINKLKENLNLAEQRSQDIEKSLQMSFQDIISDSLAARQKMETKFAAVAAEEAAKLQEIEDREKVIKTQKETIACLHAFVYGVKLTK